MPTTLLHSISPQNSLRVILVAATIAALTLAAKAQLIYQEDFESDGEAASPKRYTTVGRDVYEVDRIRNELGNQDQIGPVYFAHNNEVSYTGVPAPTPARRMAMAWDLAITEADTTPATLGLFDSAIKWLLNNKTGAKIVVAPAGTTLGVLGERLTAAGHTLVDDDTSVPDEQLTTLGDMLLHAGGGSRGAQAKFPMLVINSPDADDVLTSSIGTATAFEAGKGTITTPGHPAAGGATGEFVVATGSFTWQLLGDFLPANPIILANFIQPGDPDPITRPFIMLLNGPNDTPSGTVFGGGPFTGQSGQRFFAGAGMNKWTVPDQGDRSLTLRPVNVAGKSDVKLTLALAGTFLDFEQSTGDRGNPDYIEVVIDPDGAGPKEFERLMFFTAPDPSLKYVNDVTTHPNNPTRLGLEFKDVTYDIPAGATDLIVEIRTLSTFWNEIFAFDNIRIHSGPLTPAEPTGPVSVQDPSNVVGTGDKAWSYLIVEGESYASEVDANDGVGFTKVNDSGTITSFLNGPILDKNTTASKKGALYIQNAAKHGDKVTYQMQFAKAGTYYLYMRFSMFESGVGETSYLNEDSFFVPPDFGKDPQTDWPLMDAGGQNGGYTEGCCGDAGYLFIPEKGGGGVRVSHGNAFDDDGNPTGRTYWEGNFHWVDLISSQFLVADTQGEPRVRRKYEVTPAQVGKTLTWTISNREPGMAVDLWLFSTNPDLMDQYSQEELDQILLQGGTPGSGPSLSISKTTGKVTLTYTGTLQSSDTVNGTFTDVAGAASPYSPDTTTASARFYRARQ